MSKAETARKLAQAHYRIEPGLRQIFRILGSAEREAQPQEPIKLLVINEDTVPCGIVPLGFGPHPDSEIPSASIIVEITPEEFELVKDGTMELPDGWVIGEELPRELVASDA